ncbi:MAG: SGNH/GDSL hydrolase family protein [Bacteroidota bacterium]
MHNSLFILFSLLFFFSCKQSQTVSEEKTNIQLPPPNPLVRFEDVILKYEAQDKENPPQKGGIVFCGSSSIRMWRSLAEDLAPLNVINRGFGGSTFPELIHYADRIIFPYEPSCIVVYEGDNDITSDKILPGHVLANLKRFHKKVQEQQPGTKVWFIAVKPSVARKHLYDKLVKTNTMIQEYIESVPELEYLDVATPMLTDEGEIRTDIFIKDNLHMNATGYEIWTKVIRPVMMAECGG